jgi:hypothetical protein
VLASVVAVLTAFGLHYNSEIRGGRAEVRYLLVRCEIAMGFYTTKEQLYTDDELSYPTKGGFLEVTYAVVIVAAAIGLITLIIRRRIIPTLLAQVSRVVITYPLVSYERTGPLVV